MVLKAETEPAVRLGAVAVAALDGPAVAVTFGEQVLLLSPADAARWGHALLRESGRAEGFVLTAAAMRVNHLSGRTIDRVLTWAVHHTVGAKQ